MELNLVTGGTGYIGRELVDALVRRGKAVRVIGRRPVTRWRHQRAVEHIRADIGAPQVLERALEGVNEVYHLAAATRGDWNTHRRVTVDVSQRLLELVAQRGGGRVVFVSSLGNYDANAMTDDGEIDEMFALERNPEGRADYAHAKTEADLAAQSYLNHPTLKLTIVRPGLVYGPGMKNPLSGLAMKVLGMWLVLGTRDKPLPLVYLDDLVNALMLIMISEHTIGGVYNVVGSPQLGSNQYIDLFRKYSGDRRPMIRLPIHRMIWLCRVADTMMGLVGCNRQIAYKIARLSKRLRYSSERLQRDIGFQNSLTLDEAMRRMLAEV